jgi:hypothetical protein
MASWLGKGWQGVFLWVLNPLGKLFAVTGMPTQLVLRL